MSYENGMKPFSLPASADLSNYQYRFVKMTSTGVALQDGAGAHCIGVLQNKPSALGEAASVAPPGMISKVVAYGAISINAPVRSTTEGKAVEATATGNIVQGIALEAASAANDVIAVLLTMFGELN